MTHLNEDNGKGSFARLASLLIVVFTLLWLSYAVYVAKGVNGVDFQGPLLFMVTGGLTFYGSNKGTTVFAKRGSIPGPVVAPPQS